ncbi:hypothetical protein G7Y79_00039g075450 [Physcia stellaris]|nr:hypothetical protein G7Y79_00039g075450 [Physcia stellaris]
MSNAGMPTRKRKRSEAHSSPSPSPSPRSPSPRSPSAPHPSHQPAQLPPVYPSEEATAQAGILAAAVASERDHTRPSLSATQVPLPSSANHPSSTRSHSHSQPFVQSWLESSAYGESPDQPASTPVSPQPAVSAPNPDQILPLTRSNLRVHEKGTMVRPTKSASGASSQPHNIPRLRNALDLNSIKPHKSTDADTFREVIDLGKNIIKTERHGTTMTDDSAKKAVKLRETYSTTSETSFLVKFLDAAIIKEKREVLYGTREGVKDKDWVEDHILGVWDSPFIRNALSGIITGNAKKDKTTFDPKKIMSVPKPDITYGLMRDAFMESQWQVLEKYVDLYKVHPMVVSAFLVVECKSYNQSIEHAEIQAQRAGAALVCAQRQIYHLTKTLHDKDGMDLRSMVFSLCIDMTHAILNVHFITIQEEGLRYHHHNIEGYSFVKPNSFKDLRRDIWNIMDWGFGTHKKRVLETLAILETMDAAQIWPKEMPVRLMTPMKQHLRLQLRRNGGSLSGALGAMGGT